VPGFLLAPTQTSSAQWVLRLVADACLGIRGVVESTPTWHAVVVVAAVVVAVAVAVAFATTFEHLPVQWPPHVVL